MDNFKAPKHSVFLKSRVLFSLFKSSNTKKNDIFDVLRISGIHLFLVGLVCFGLFLIAAPLSALVNQSFRDKCAPGWSTFKDQCQNNQKAQAEVEKWKKADKHQLKTTSKQLESLLTPYVEDSKKLGNAQFEKKELGSILAKRSEGVETSLAFLTLARQDANEKEKASIDKTSQMLYTLKLTGQKFDKVDEKASDTSVANVLFPLVGLIIGLVALGAGLSMLDSWDAQSWRRELKDIKQKYAVKMEDHFAADWIMAMQNSKDGWRWSWIVWLDENKHRLTTIKNIMPDKEAKNLEKMFEMFETQLWHQANGSPTNPESRRLFIAKVAKTMPVVPTMIARAKNGEIELDDVPDPDTRDDYARRSLIFY